MLTVCCEAALQAVSLHLTLLQGLHVAEFMLRMAQLGTGTLYRSMYCEYLKLQRELGRMQQVLYACKVMRCSDAYHYNILYYFLGAFASTLVAVKVFKVRTSRAQALQQT